MSRRVEYTFDVETYSGVKPCRCGAPATLEVEIDDAWNETRVETYRCPICAVRDIADCLDIGSDIIDDILDATLDRAKTVVALLRGRTRDEGSNE